ncbi:MAG: undecaprenyldiphospho-muramoylpentapeptide beta-N-acetylglucosaminyltransferase [Muribaculaceae bacterium]|nr:undecaprenyldiphospho-muramoylpentapeptide beta-N-acetylglucosaminyltransferase [Muribaculaceae bacterium]
MKYLISGGGTGGHIFPALSIANAVKAADPEADILFVGAIDRMEMEKVPQAGYKIIGLPVAGFNRKNVLKNFKVLLKLYNSIRLAKKILKEFNPDIAVGVGGYASGPILKAAQKKGIPTMLQEQNSYAGVTNKLLAQKANAIFVAYDGMERFFPAEKIIKTGNPIRKNIKDSEKIDKRKAKEELGFDPDKLLIVAVGGSLGARTINESILASIPVFMKNDINLLWQTGKQYAKTYLPEAEKQSKSGIKAVPFIDRMDLVYAAADLIISRAGAATISEIQYLGVPSILIPSPNVAEDHQRKNAEALVKEGAAQMLLDKDAEEKLPGMIRLLIKDPEKLIKLGENARKMGLGNADNLIAAKVIETAKQNRKESNEG